MIYLSSLIEYLRAYIERADAKIKSGLHQEAIADCSKALDNIDSFDKDNLGVLGARAYFLRGQSKRALNDLDGAISDFTKSIDLSDYWMVDTLIARAMARADNGDYSSAIDDYSIAIQLNPSDYHLYIQRSYLRNVIGDSYGKKMDDLLAAEFKDKCNDSEV